MAPQRVAWKRCWIAPHPSSGTLAVNSPQRAAQLRTAIERLGPAYVKVAQALSTRVDLLDEAYLREIESLQDRVPPFDTALALTEMEAGACGATTCHHQCWRYTQCISYQQWWHACVALCLRITTNS